MWLNRTILLIGKEAVQKLQEAHVVVAGLGGVGAYAAEMLVRAGIGQLTIIDADTVNETNKNRQLLALDSTLGQEKTAVMSRRLLDINPALYLTTHTLFLNADNIPLVIATPPQQISKSTNQQINKTHNSSPITRNSIDYLIDAIDTLAPKIELISYCVRNGISVVSAMGAGAKYDATALEITDISKSYNCPLAHQLRKRLRREKGIKRGVKVVFSTELPDNNAIELVNEQNKRSIVGTISYLPAVFGCLCAQAVIEDLMK
jgi:tRNA A37 threonylcarbamoyladenosine dehydratase